ncbi:MAG: sulfotransferase [Roseibium sp.]|uniref:tetratricopeptide repeat-containing sulfotransferase family protein n=1 Tax=Roseibium sp. TaxID=1936156 RepID=UPI00263714B1|nr:tetratricopeptide repeat-containing sulfotransferase family protein [Roseibium sp.]MCV0424506.1 sulfotransferase [Roseibium sp.]
MYPNPMEAVQRYIDEKDFGMALEILMDMHQVNPQDPQVNYWIGVIFLTVGQCDKAISHLLVASKVAKKEAAIFATLADALNLDSRPEEALPHARKAVALDKNSEFAHRILGEIYSVLRRPVMAEHAFSNAIRLNPSSAIAHLSLSRLQVSTGNLDLAAHHFQQAFELAPNEPSVLISARDHPSSEITQQVLQNIEAALTAPDTRLTRLEKARLAFTAGKICDDIGDFPKAFHYFEKHRSDYYKGYAPDSQEEFFSAYETVFNKQFFEDRQDFALSSDRPVFVFGMPRSGTSLVESILSAHPKCSAAGELVFFEDQILELTGGASDAGSYFAAVQNLDRKTAQKIGRKYLSLLDGFGKKNFRVVNKLPQNFEHLWLLALLFPNAHFCHVQRDPADTCVSIYMTPLASKHTYNENQETLAHYFGQYRRLMRHWHKVLPVKIHDQSYEDLVAAPGEHRRSLVAHVRLPWDDACTHHENNDAQVFTFSMTQVRKPIYTSAVNRSEKYSMHIQPLLKALSRDD